MLAHFSDIGITWENKDSCDEQYGYVTGLYLLYILGHTYNIITDQYVGAPGHGREPVYILNTIDKIFLSKLMTKTQLHGSKFYENLMSIITSDHTEDVSLAR